MLFGAHCSTVGGVEFALDRAGQIGGSICQIFVKNNMQWFGKAPSADSLARFAERRVKFAGVFGHTGYLINLGAPPSDNREKSIRSLIQEIGFAADLKLPFLVLHPGAHLGSGEEAGLDWIVKGLDDVVAATKNTPVRIALENTAGQGSCLGFAFEHLARIFERVRSPERLGLCLDTAHLFASGHDIRLAAGWNSVIDNVDNLIGLKQILAFHLNDSKTGLGSRVDRHEHIGKGKIGLDAFRHIVNDLRFAQTPGCLETPKSKDLAEDIENLAVLRSLADGPPL
jgi:deoxyribonuclease-4